MRRKEWKGKGKAMAAAGALLLSGVFAAGTVTGSLYNIISVSAGETSGTEISQTTVFDSAASGLPDVSDVVAECMPSVVSITNTIEVTSSVNNMFSRFNQDSASTSTSETYAYGSGVIIDQNEEELLVVTNNHVAVYDESGNSSFYQYTASTKGLSVTFADGTEHEANLKGTDAEADLAVIAVDLSDLSEETKSSIKIATIGSSDDALVGQGVIAIGNALGLGQTTTIGYISALNRDVTTEDGYTRTLMQVDAAINAGNSGGGLFNGKGELIGINSAKYSSVGVEGIGYAIPISNVTDIIDGLKEYVTRELLDADERGYLGIVGTDVSGTMVNSYGYPSGAQIVQIVEGSPAEESGLQLGDIITAIDSKKIASYTELSNALSYYQPGEEVEITVQRIEGRTFTEKTITVTLAEKEAIQE
jgi:serine protease Do